VLFVGRIAEIHGALPTRVQGSGVRGRRSFGLSGLPCRQASLDGPFPRNHISAQSSDSHFLLPEGLGPLAIVLAAASFALSLIALKSQPLLSITINHGSQSGECIAMTKGQDVSTSMVSRAPQGISEPALSAPPTPIEFFWELQRAVLVASAIVPSQR